MTSPLPRAGLYAITDSRLIGDIHLSQAVGHAIAGGARMIQYREKHLQGTDREETATALATLCRRHGIPLIINDDAELAARCGAGGVHLGRDDTDPAAARALLGNDAIIGVSCYDSLARAIDASAAGADYVAFGRFHSSRSKPDAVPANPDLLRAARAQLALPLVAIGGITPDNGRPLVEAGANLLAAIEGVFGAADIRAAAQRYASLFP